MYNNWVQKYEFYFYWQKYLWKKDNPQLNFPLYFFF